MKRKFLIGLGGSGGKIVANLMERLKKEGNYKDLDEVVCIAIDTHQETLEKLSAMGIRTACISNFGTVGQIINDLRTSDADVYDWCPGVENEGNFRGDDLSAGASQCRLKSRLGLAKFLSNPHNELKTIIDESFAVSSTEGNLYDAPPKIVIASSIAGGTGAGIFIQVALYIKKLLSDVYDKNKIIVHGLFALPTLFEDDVEKEKLPSLYANAYAVVRELNAMNLICGDKKETVYGDIKVNIEMSSKSEGDLFLKKEGRYGEKPYDILYFIDKVNSLGNVLGGLDAYYKAMADMAYSHIYSEISERVFEIETNEKNVRDIEPTAIYASAGASSMEYPFEGILNYFAHRAMSESISDVWKIIDTQWQTHVSAEQNKLRKGKYVPKESERADFYIKSFSDLIVKEVGVENEYEFLSDMVKRGEKKMLASDALMASIVKKAQLLVKSDEGIIKEKKSFSLSDLALTKAQLTKIVEQFDDPGKEATAFNKIVEIERNLPMYCNNCVTHVAKIAESFINEIYCDIESCWSYYDEKEGISIVNDMLKGDNGEFVHPIAARFLLYSFKKLVEKKIAELGKTLNDTPANDVADVIESLRLAVVESQKTILANESGSRKHKGKSNAYILADELDDTFFPVRDTKAKLEKYFEKLASNVELADSMLADALLLFTFKVLIGRINNLIAQYEYFFDNIDTFAKTAEKCKNTSAVAHEKSWNTVYVCASSDVKEKMYDKFGKDVDLNTGELASNISLALFGAMRLKAATSFNAAESKKESVKTAESFYGTISKKIAETLLNLDAVATLDKNVFEAMLYEYELVNEGKESADDVAKYTLKGESEAKQRVDSYIAKKFSALITAGNPCLHIAEKDIYYNYTHEDFAINQDLAQIYSFVSHHSDISDTITETFLPTSMDTYYKGIAAKVPSLNGHNLTFCKGNKVDKRKILCYCTIHCLQMYQIRDFDENSNGNYYASYAKRIAQMENLKKYSMTPHIDIRWHKSSCMPYVNPVKNLEATRNGVKAFIYGICNENIGYDYDGAVSKLIYRDPDTAAVSLISYDGNVAMYNMVNRVLDWLGNEEPIAEKLAEGFEKMIEKEVAALEQYADVPSTYKMQITKSAFFKRICEDVLRYVPFFVAKNGKSKKAPSHEKISLVGLAYNVHIGEEKRYENDRNSGERIIDTLCYIIRKYAEAVCSEKNIKDENSAEYSKYADICTHFCKKLLDAYLAYVEEGLKTKKSKNVKSQAKSDKRYVWAVGEFKKAFPFLEI